MRIADGSRSTYVYDSANQLVTSQDSSGVTTYTFDAAGNLAVEEAPGGRTTNTWDAENRLTLVQAPSSVINTMAYRADGLRVEKQDSSGTSRFIWDGAEILQETDAANATVCQYTLQPVLHGHLVSQRRGNASRFYHFDALGSTRQLTDASQAVTDNYIYQAYGVVAASTGETVNPFRWVGLLGYFYDPDRLAYYIRARHYAPVLARWLSQDPLGYRMGNQTLHESEAEVTRPRHSLG